MAGSAESVGTYGAKDASIKKLASISGDGGSIGTASLRKMSNSDLADLLITASVDTDIVMLQKITDYLDRPDMVGKKNALHVLLTNPQSSKRKEYNAVLTAIDLHTSFRFEKSTVGLPTGRNTLEEKAAKEDALEYSPQLSDELGNYYSNAIYGVTDSVNGTGAVVTSKGQYDNRKSIKFKTNVRIFAQNDAPKFKNKSLIEANELSFTYSPINVGSNLGDLALGITAQLTNNTGSAAERGYFQRTLYQQPSVAIDGITDKYRGAGGAEADLKSRNNKLGMKASVVGSVDQNNLTAFEGTGTVGLRFIDTGMTIGDKKVFVNFVGQVGALTGTQPVAGAAKGVSKNSYNLGMAVETNKFWILQIDLVAVNNSYDRTNNIAGTDFKEKSLGVAAKFSVDVSKIFDKSWGLVASFYINRFNTKIEYDSTLRLPNPNGALTNIGANFSYQIMPGLSAELGYNKTISDYINANTSSKVSEINSDQFNLGIKYHLPLDEKEDRDRLRE